MASLDNGMQVVRRVLRLLECFTPEKPELSLTDLYRLLNLPKSTVHRLLSFLLQEGYVILNPDTLKYHISLKVLRLANAAVSQLEIEQAADVYLRELVLETGGNANLAILHKADGMVLYLKTISPDMMLSNIGRRSHIHSTALGKVLAAFEPERVVDRIIRTLGMPAFTPHTITDPNVFKEHLALVRQCGYAVDDQEAHPGWFCVAAPIQDVSGNVVAAISTAGPLFHYTHEKIPKIAFTVCEKANRISRMLGCSEDKLIRYCGDIPAITSTHSIGT